MSTRMMMRTTQVRRRRRRLTIGLVTAACLGLAACNTYGGSPNAAAPMATQATGEQVVAFDRGFAEGWVDYGWAATVEAGRGAQLDLGGWGGWIVARPGLGRRYANVELRVRLNDASPENLLRVHLGNDEGDDFPTVVPVFSRDGESWTATLPVTDVNPGGLTFDRIVLQAARELPAHTVIDVERISFAIVTPPHPVATETQLATVSADCAAAGAHSISPDIYGVAFSARREGTDAGPWDLGTTARRWGGNPTSRYNWQDGHAWNTAADYFWRNVAILGGDEPAWQQFLDANRAHGVASAVTVPTIGWVAKDTSSYSFPVSVFGSQEQTDPDIPNAGNGNRPDGTAIRPGAPTETSVEAPPAMIAAWVRAMEASGEAPAEYILDNEPDLWNDTHRDVHPQPLTYDELAQRMIDYGSAVRAAAPDAQIAGPASWGWWGYFYSAADAKAGFGDHPDRTAHGNRPLLEWLVEELAAYQARTGVRVLDTLDVHYYPQAKGVYAPNGQGGGDLETSRRRVRATRSLWDPTYTDESWIDDQIELLPRMQRLIAEHDPTLRLSIGEYSFGGENNPSGAVAQAEALGRFAQYDVDSAYYWTYPAVDSAVGTAFRAYRNFDGRGGHFLDRWVPSVGSDNVSLFTSTDGHDVVAVLVNRSDTARQVVSASFANCGALGNAETFQYDGSANALAPVSVAQPAPGTVQLELPAWSVTTVRLTPTKG